MKRVFAVAATISLLATAGAAGRSSLNEASAAQSVSGGKFDAVELSADQVQRLQARFQYWRSDTEPQVLVAR